MRRLSRALLELLLPPACAGCRTPVSGAAALCRRCDAALPRLPAGLCAGCLERAARPPGARCAGCTVRRGPLEAAAAVVRFEGAVEGWIHRFKYPGGGLAGLDPAPLAVARALAREAAARVPGPLPDLVVPVPLHPARLRERGFNPAGLLARAVAEAAGLPHRPRALERLRDTRSQTGLDRRARARNVAGAFGPGPGPPLPPRIWLVDDVFTTGATLEAAAQALRRAGARAVVGVCVARTPAPG